MAREAARKAEEHRMAALKAAEEARQSAQAARSTGPAAAPPPRGPTAFDGTWVLTRSVEPGCGPRGATFTIRIANGEVFGPGGRGSISPEGKLVVPGQSNNFNGMLRSNTGSGTYSGLCKGTFTAKRN